MKLFRLLAVTACTFVLCISAKQVQAQGTYVYQQAFKVTYVAPGGAAFNQGMEVDDMILSVNGNTVRSGQDLRYYLSQAGGVARLEVRDWRTGNINQMTVYLQNGLIGVNGLTAELPGSSSGPIAPVPVTPYSGGNNDPYRPIGR